MKKKHITIFFLTISSLTLFGHSGRTDRNGGHNDNINGGYHYHNGNASSNSNHNNKVSHSEDSSNTKWYIIGGIITLGAIFIYNKSND